MMLFPESRRLVLTCPETRSCVLERTAGKNYSPIELTGTFSASGEHRGKLRGEFL